jgi:hypothetical protein
LPFDHLSFYTTAIAHEPCIDHCQSWSESAPRVHTNE